MKALQWVGTSHVDIQRFAEVARQRAGYELYRVQAGLEPSDWKPMSSVGPGVHEIRIHAKDEFRVVYIASFKEAVFVLHAFQKKTRKTAKHDLDLAAKRFTNLVNERKKTGL